MSGATARSGARQGATAAQRRCAPQRRRLRPLSCASAVALLLCAGAAAAPRAAEGFGPPDPPAQDALHTPSPAGATPPSTPKASADVAAAAPSPESLPLGGASRAEAGASPAEQPPAADHSLVNLQTLGALALVAALAVGVKVALSRSLRRAGALAAHLGPAGRAPSGVLTVLGRYPVGRRQSLVLLKVDQRALLLAHTEQGFTTLTEFTDPEEVASLLVATRDEEGASLSSRFNQMLRELERDPSVSAAPLRETPLASRQPLAAALEADSDPAASLKERLEHVRGRVS